MSVSKAQQKAVHKYVKKNYDRIEITTPKGMKEQIKDHAAAQDESMNAFINRAIVEAMERDVVCAQDREEGVPDASFQSPAAGCR